MRLFGRSLALAAAAAVATAQPEDLEVPSFLEPAFNNAPVVSVAQRTVLSGLAIPLPTAAT